MSLDSCKRSIALIDLLLEGELTGDDRTWLDEHLRMCERCRAELDFQTNLRKVLLQQKLPIPGEHLTDDIVGTIRLRARRARLAMLVNLVYVAAAGLGLGVLVYLGMVARLGSGLISVLNHLEVWVLRLSDISVAASYMISHSVAVLEILFTLTNFILPIVLAVWGLRRLAPILR